MSWNERGGLAAFVAVIVACPACGDDGSGGGGAGPYDGETVIGTRHTAGECETAAPFAAKCEEEGGILGDRCQDALHCGGDGYGARCYAPPPAPSASEFVCDGLLLCSAGTLCVIERPMTDGCFEHLCEPMPSACADDPTCACIEGDDAGAGGSTGSSSGSGGDVDSCTADGAGHLTVTRTRRF